MGERYHPRIIRSRDVPVHEQASTSPVAVLNHLIQWRSRARRAKQEDAAFREGFRSAWQFCTAVWTSNRYLCAWLWLISTPTRPPQPYPCWLRNRLFEEYEKSFDALTVETLSPNPSIAVHAIWCLSAKPELIDSAAFDRTEEITLRDWTIEYDVTLGDWARMVNDESRRDW